MLIKNNCEAFADRNSINADQGLFLQLPVGQWWRLKGLMGARGSSPLPQSCLSGLGDP